MNELTRKIAKGKKVELGLHGKGRKPTMIYINLDEACNENCVFCVVKGTNQGVFGSMSTNGAKKIIADFAHNGGQAVVFTGGEPTLRNDLPAIINYTEKFQEITSVGIITNGVRLSDKTYLSILLKADFKKILNFSISLHSHKKIVSEQLTRLSDSFEKTIKGMRNIITNDRQITIYQVITTKSYKDLYVFAKFLYTNFPKIKIITLAYPFPQGNAVENEWIFPKISKVRPYLMKALNFFEKKNYTISIASCGQFPLCAIPGFEETVLASLSANEETTLGVVGEKAYHDFEMAGAAFQQFYKNKNKLCEKCLLNTICQGFWKKYTEMFDFDGLRPVTEHNFKGNKVQDNLENDSDFISIKQGINRQKLNLIQLKKYTQPLFEALVSDIKKNHILAIAIDKNKHIIYS